MSWMSFDDASRARRAATVPVPGRASNITSEAPSGRTSVYYYDEPADIPDVVSVADRRSHTRPRQPTGRRHNIRRVVFADDPGDSRPRRRRSPSPLRVYSRASSESSDDKRTRSRSRHDTWTEDDDLLDFRSEVRYRGRYRRNSDDSVNSLTSFIGDDAAPLFTLSRKVRPPSPAIEVASYSDVIDVDEKPASQQRPALFAPGVCLSVVDSQYAGEPAVDNNHHIDVQTIEGPSASSQRLFKWIRLDDASMVFADFWTAALRINDLTGAERAAVSKLLTRVRQKFDKPLHSNGSDKARVMQPSFLVAPIDPSPDVAKRSSKGPVVTWICLPYFLLQQYNDLTSNGKAGFHPVQALLQTQYAASRARELQQAVCRLPGNLPGSCFHTAQAWFLIIGDSTLLTYTRLPVSQIDGLPISIGSAPSRDAILGSDKILVSYHSVVWCLNAADCSNYFDLKIHFVAFWPDYVKLLHKGEVVTPQTWPRLMASTARSNAPLRLKLVKVGGGYVRHASGKLSAPPTSAPAREPQDLHSDTLVEELLSDPDRQGQRKAFTVFGWPDAASSQDVKPASDHTASISGRMHRDLTEIHDHMCVNLDWEQLAAYQQCPESSHLDVWQSLWAESMYYAQQIADEKSPETLKDASRFERRVEVFNAATSVTKFFFPDDSQGPTIAKFWGAIGSIVIRPASSQGRSRDTRGSRTEAHARRLQEFQEALDGFTAKTSHFKDLLSEMQWDDRSSMSVPNELVNAWMQIVTFATFVAQYEFIWDEIMSDALRLAEKGMSKMLRARQIPGLLSKAVVMPYEIASSITLRLLHDVTDGRPDISETYRRYLSVLEAQVDQNPTNRSHQENLARMRQEIGIIQGVLAKQSFIVKHMKCSSESTGNLDMRKLDMVKYEDDYGHRSRSRLTNRPKYPPVTRYGDDAYRRTEDAGFYYGDVEMPRPTQDKLSPTDPDGIRGVLLQEADELLEAEVQDFQEISMRINDIARFNMLSIETNKDRQENAIYIFTIVTIIFLPLSTVAGILGMNTNDVRNMTADQWVFWAVSIPLLLTVIAVCLVFLGGFGKIARAGAQFVETVFGADARRVARVDDGSGYFGGMPVYRRQSTGELEDVRPGGMWRQRRQQQQQQDRGDGEGEVVVRRVHRRDPVGYDRYDT